MFNVETTMVNHSLDGRESEDETEEDVLVSNNLFPQMSLINSCLDTE